MDKNLELAVQYFKMKCKFYIGEQSLINQLESFEKEINSHLVILQQKRKYRLSKKICKKEQETRNTLETIANTTHKKLLNLYEELFNEVNENTKKGQEKLS